MERWALAVALVLANGSMLFGLMYHSELIYSTCKAVVIFVVMYVLCRIVIVVWDKAGPQEESETETIKTTMDMLDDLDERGIKVTYNPLDEPEEEQGSESLESEKQVSEERPGEE